MTPNELKTLKKLLDQLTLMIAETIARIEAKIDLMIEVADLTGLAGLADVHRDQRMFKLRPRRSWARGRKHVLRVRRHEARAPIVLHGVLRRVCVDA